MGDVASKIGQALLVGNNCHQYAAHAMNLMAYDKRRDWNMVHLAATMLFMVGRCRLTPG